MNVCCIIFLLVCFRSCMIKCQLFSNGLYDSQVKLERTLNSSSYIRQAVLISVISVYKDSHCVNKTQQTVHTQNVLYSVQYQIIDLYLTNFFSLFKSFYNQCCQHRGQTAQFWATFDPRKTGAPQFGERSVTHISMGFDLALRN